MQYKTISEHSEHNLLRGYALRFKTGLLSLLFFGSFALTMSAQQTNGYSADLQISTPYSAYLEDYANPSSSKMALTLKYSFGDAATSQVKLKMFLEKGNSLVAYNGDVVVGAPSLNLPLGQPRQLTAAEIAAYFKLENLQGIGLDRYNTFLSEGIYRVTFEMYDLLGAKVGSASQQMWITLNDPPTLNSPTNGQSFQWAAISNGINFQWMPRAIQGLASTEYEFTLIKLVTANTNGLGLGLGLGQPATASDVPASDQFLTATPKYQTTTSNTSINLVYGSTLPPLDMGATYAWRVKAKAQTGAVNAAVYKNDGYSEIYTFKYFGGCNSPNGLQLTPDAYDQITLKWTPYYDLTNSVRGYRIAYRKYSTSVSWQWVEYTTNESFYILTGLEANTEYEVKVGNICSDNSVTFGNPLTTTTKPAGQLNGISQGDCGVEPNIELGTNVRNSLEVGEIIFASNFPITLTKVFGANGIFSGEGYVGIPFLNIPKIRVKFDNVGIDINKKLTSGFIQTTFDPTLSNIVDVDEIIRQIAVFFDDLSTKLNELLALIKSNDTQGIENWKKLNKEEFDTFIKYSTSGGAQSTSSAVRDEAIRQLKEQLFGAGTTGTTEQNVKELLAQISLKKLAEELKNAKIPSEDSKNVSVLTAQTWVTPAGSPFELPANTKINNYFYCYWGLEKNIKAGALRGFNINGVNYAAAFSGSNEFLGYYDFDEWKAKGSPTDAKKYEVNDAKSYETLTGLRDVYLVCYDGEPILGTFTKVSVKKVQATFDPKKLVAWRFLDKQIATVTLSANNQMVITSNNLTFSCSKSVGKGDFATLYNYCKNIDDNSIIEKLKDLIKAKGKTDKELYFDEIITIDSDADQAKKDAALARLTSVATEVSNKRVLYLMFDANKNLFETKSAFGTTVPIDVKGSLTAITTVIGKHKSEGIFIVTKVITAIFQGLEEVLSSLEIPAKFYNSEDKANYDPWLYDLWKVVNVANPASSLVRSGLFQAPGIKLPGETSYDTPKMSEAEFALYCGLWNGLIGQIKGIAGSAALVSQAPEYVYHLIFNIDNEATNLGNKISNFSFTAVGHMIAKKVRKNNANQNAHLYGEVVTNILTIYLSIAKVGKMSEVIGTLDKLDAISQTLSLTGKAFKPLLKTVIKGGKIIFKTGETVTRGFVTGFINTPKGVLSATLPFGPQIASGIEGGIEALKDLVARGEAQAVKDASGNLVKATVEDEVGGVVNQVEGFLYEVKLPDKAQGENTMLVIVTKSADDIIASLRAKVSTWSVADADRFIADFTGNNDAINRFLGGFVSPEAWLTVSKAGRNEAAKSLKVLEGLSSLGLPNSTLVADFLKFSDKTIIKFAEDLYGPANAYFSTFLKDNPNVLKALVQHKEDSYAKYVMGAIAQVSELEFTDPNLFKKLDDWIRYSLETKTFLNRMTQARKFQRDLYAKVVKKENFLKSAEEVTFDVTINGVTNRTRLDGIFLKGDKYIVFEAKLGDAVLSKKQEFFFKALKDGVGEIKPVAGKAGDVFLPSEIGKDVRAKFSDSYYLNEDLINLKQ